MRIGVFDSGVGGLSILHAIVRVLPDASFAYCCDSLNFPYGTKSEAEVMACATEVTKKFYDHAGIDLLVIACNTASTVALTQIRSILPIPVVGVVPAVKPAAQRSKSKVIGVLATPRAISMPYLDALIREFAHDCRVIKCGSSKLVQLAERKLRGHVISTDDIKSELGPIIDAIPMGIDQLVLGCTHFPLLADELRQVLPASIAFVDSGAAIGARVENIIRDLEYQGVKPRSASAEKIIGWCSGSSFPLSLPWNLGNLILRTLP